MADVKITGLTAISTIDTANDPIPIVDVSDTSMASTGTTKKISINQVLASGAAGTFSSATISGITTVSAGNVTSPSITTAGDTNTGVFFPALDSVAITTAGVESLRINSSNQVSIATAGTTSLPCLTQNSDTNTGLYFPAADTLGFVTGGSERGRIDLNGNTILGGSTAYTLFQNANGAFTSKLQAQAANASVGIGVVTTGTKNTYASLFSDYDINCTGISWGQTGSFAATPSFYFLSGINIIGEFAGAVVSNNFNFYVYTRDASINSLRVGKGQSNVATNTAFGFQALHNSTTSGTYNIAIGYNCLDALTTGSNNLGSGRDALGAATTGSDSVALGNSSLSVLTTGNRNTSVGSGSGSTVTTGSDNTCVGYNTSFGSTTASGRIAIGKGVSATANNRITIGIDSNIAELDLDGADTSWSASSDERLKKNIQPLAAGLSFINELRPVSFQWRSKRDVPVELAHLHADSDEPVHGDAAKVYHGFIAQEVKAIIDAHPEVVSGQHLWEVRDDGVQTLAPGDLIPILVNAIKQLSSRVHALENT